MAPGGPPLGTWGGGNVPMPVRRSISPLRMVDSTDPGQGPGFPTHPIALPPDLPPTMPSPDNRPIEWKSGWTQATGVVVVERAVEAASDAAASRTLISTRLM